MVSSYHVNIPAIFHLCTERVRADMWFQLYLLPLLILNAIWNKTKLHSSCSAVIHDPTITLCSPSSIYFELRCIICWSMNSEQLNMLQPLSSLSLRWNNGQFVFSFHNQQSLMWHGKLTQQWKSTWQRHREQQRQPATFGRPEIKVFSNAN